MFAVLDLAPGETGVSFKCTPEEFADLVEREHIRPAAYAKRYYWVTVCAWSAVADRELRRLVKDSYGMAPAKLPKKTHLG